MNNQRNILFLLYALSMHQCFCQYVPVALLFETQQASTQNDDFSGIDPIITELAIHIDQQHCPVIASRQLVHQLVRHQQHAMKAQLDPRTKLGKLFNYLTHFSKKLPPSVEHCYGNHVHPASAQQQGPPATQPLCAQEIDILLENHSNILAHLFITRIPIASWHIYQIYDMWEKNPSPPLYLLMPPSMQLTDHLTLRDDIGLFYKDYTVLWTQATSEPSDIQKNDHDVFSMRTVKKVLETVQARVHEDVPPQLIIMLGGHGLYTRSKYGMLTDRLPPTRFDNVPTPDQYAMEPKDTRGAIAGLKVPSFIELLMKLQTIPVALLYYDSCFSGNHHLVSPYRTPEGVPLELPYMVATNGIDGGLSHQERFALSFESADNSARLCCPLDPKQFFIQVSYWFARKQEQRPLYRLKPAFLAITGGRQKNNVMIRQPNAPSFTPLVSQTNACIMLEQLGESPDPVVLAQDKPHLFLGHNKVDRTIVTKTALIRSIIPTNSTHYIKKIECTDPENRDLLGVLSQLFFHEYNMSVMNRIIFFIKELKITTQNKTHTLQDLLILHHAHSEKNKKRLALWRNASDNHRKAHTYSLIIPYADGQLLMQNKVAMLPILAVQAMLNFLSFETNEQSYIEAPELTDAYPHAFDDSAIKACCKEAYQRREFGQKTIDKIWQLLGY